jgi:hypothetical protein
MFTTQEALMTSDAEEPVHLEQDEATGDRFLVYGSDKGLRLDIRFEGDTLWMTQAQIAELFGKDRTSVTKHVQNILEDGELDEPTSVKKLHISHGRPATLYNLDMIISVGYRVSSAQATMFRRWATGILVQYARKGFVVDSIRLKQPDSSDRFAELREIIRDIRSDEGNVYRELRRICTMAQDYDVSGRAAQEFFQQMQAKLIYAVTSNTPSEIVATRADSSAENMGLQTWPNDNIRKADVTVSKNYLATQELKELNRLTTILLDIFEDQMDIGKLLLMADARRLLDDQLKNLGRAVLRDGGRVSADAAKAKAEGIYSIWQDQRKQLQHAQADAAIAELASATRRPKPR